MKKIYTWGGKFAERNLTVYDLIRNKGKRKYIQTTAINSEEAAAAKQAGFDMLLCKSPNIKDVRAGAREIFLTATIDLALFPLEEDVLKEAFNAMKDGADQIYTARGPHIVEMLSKEEIPVMCHLGLVPRKSSWRGGLRAVGRTAEEAYDLFNRFKIMENAGAISAECEVINQEIMTEIYSKTSMIISSLGSGTSGDIIYLFQDDICGEQESIPRHARSFGKLFELKRQIYDERVKALSSYKEAVFNKSFPDESELVKIDKAELDKFKKLIS